MFLFLSNVHANLNEHDDFVGQAWWTRNSQRCLTYSFHDLIQYNNLPGQLLREGNATFCRAASSVRLRQGPLQTPAATRSAYDHPSSCYFLDLLTRCYLLWIIFGLIPFLQYTPGSAVEATWTSWKTGAFAASSQHSRTLVSQS